MAINKRFFFKNMEKLESLENFANDELKSLERLIESEQLPHEVDFTFELFPTHAHNRAALHVIAGKLNLYASHEGSDIFKQIKDVVEKMAAELRKAKEEQNEIYKDKDSFKSA